MQACRLVQLLPTPRCISPPHDFVLRTLIVLSDISIPCFRTPSRFRLSCHISEQSFMQACRLVQLHGTGLIQKKSPLFPGTTKQSRYHSGSRTDDPGTRILHVTCATSSLGGKCLYEMQLRYRTSNTCQGLRGFQPAAPSLWQDSRHLLWYVNQYLHSFYDYQFVFETKAHFNKRAGPCQGKT